jgi:iron complex outermembrane recepter protein
MRHIELTGSDVMKPYRINEAFGDTVSWDLIPDIAIDRFDIISANPVCGRNALGGAAVITMKNGVTYQGFENELAGGSFGPRSEQFQCGLWVGDWGACLAGRWYGSDSWRQFSPNRLQQIYADSGTQSEKASLDISFTAPTMRSTARGRRRHKRSRSAASSLRPRQSRSMARSG